MIGSDNLTDSVPHKAMRRLTVAGMASWGGEGPAGTTCRECLYWTRPDHASQRYYAWGHQFGGSLRPQKCQKACGMLNRSDIPKIAYWQSSCKFFQLNPEPPAPERPKG